jgi:hypothetical protein
VNAPLDWSSFQRDLYKYYFILLYILRYKGSQTYNQVKHWFKVQTPPPLADYALIKLAFGLFACTWSLAESFWIMSNFDWKNHSQSLASESLMEGNYNALQCLWVSCYPGQCWATGRGDQLDFWVLGFILVCYHSSLFSSLPLPLEYPHQWCSQYMWPCKIYIYISHIQV